MKSDELYHLRTKTSASEGAWLYEGAGLQADALWRQTFSFMAHLVQFEAIRR